jgi:hypothetical protein
MNSKTLRLNEVDVVASKAKQSHHRSDTLPLIQSFVITSRALFINSNILANNNRQRKPLHVRHAMRASFFCMDTSLNNTD